MNDQKNIEDKKYYKPPLCRQIVVCCFNAIIYIKRQRKNKYIIINLNLLCSSLFLM